MWSWLCIIEEIYKMSSHKTVWTHPSASLMIVSGNEICVLKQVNLILILKTYNKRTRLSLHGYDRQLLGSDACAGISRMKWYGFTCSSVGKGSACSAGDLGSIPGLGRSPGEGKGNPLQYSCLESPWTEKPGGLQSMGSREWLNHHHQAKSEQRARQWSTAHCGLYMSGLETESSRWGVGRSVSILDHSALLPSCSIPSFLLLAKAEECINLWKGTNVLEALGRTLPTL